MSSRAQSLMKIVGMTLGVAVLVALCAAAVLVDKKALFKTEDKETTETQTTRTSRLAEGDRNTIVVDDDVVKALAIQTAEAESPSRHPVRAIFGRAPDPRQLQLSGSLGYDTNRFLGINTLFVGQVKQIGLAEQRKGEELDLSKPTPGPRPLDFGDQVDANQLLCVIWSKDLGVGKSQLVAAVSQLRIDRERLHALEGLFLKGSIPEQSVRDARQKVEADVIALEVARNTLRAWQLKQSEIDALEKEAENVLQRAKEDHLIESLLSLRRSQENVKELEKQQAAGKATELQVSAARRKTDSDRIGVEVARNLLRSGLTREEDIRVLEKEAETLYTTGGKRESTTTKQADEWARVEIRAPFAGTILERNVAEGKIINDVTFDLFKIGDLKKLRVWANLYEDDLADLQNLMRKGPVRWRIRLKADPNARPLSGYVERIGDVVDPNDHTVRVMGFVDNPELLMKAGQFINATIDLPPDKNEVEVPATAVVMDGKDNYLFVQRDPSKNAYTLRRVQVVRRLQDWVSVKVADGNAGEGIKPGDRVVIAGAVELKAQLDELQTKK
jgi:RND family efflux transporter MFP subunit